MDDSARPAWVKPILTGGLALLFMFLGQARLGLPPPGKLLNPFTGFWRNAEAAEPAERTLEVPGLRGPVRVVFDKREVPHIFAQNARDLFFAQGYVTARHRLWQMDIQTRAAAGRLAEVLGPGLVEKDRFQRRLGIPAAAERDVEVMQTDREAWEAAEAYSQGVNAWIQSLRPAGYPLEYKLLDYAPEPWSPVKTALLIKSMQWTLSGLGDDLPLTNTLGKFGADFVRKFFPVHEPGMDAAIPPGTPWNFRPDTVPAPDSLPPIFPMPMPESPDSPEPQAGTGNGSNNFAVAGRRTRSGRPLLANDPHLDLGLPSLWYEQQLVAPGINAYGVSLPGGPGLIIGFNRDIAWGLTNGSDDVFDWYRIEFRDSTESEYRHGGQWKPTRKVAERIRVRGRADVIDTVVYTHHGPVVLQSREKPLSRNSPARHALRWTALDGGDDVRTFLGIMKARDHAGFAAALSTFPCPAQNFVFASAGPASDSGSGEIAMYHQGHLPRKWPGQGRFLLDGGDSAQDWHGFIPQGQLPTSVNPERGWLASANQAPTDSTYPYYLGAAFLNGERAVRLAQLLSDSTALDLQGAFRIMLDDYNLLAARLLPLLLARLDRASESPDSALALLKAWDFRHRPDDAAPALFDQWWRLVYRSIWQDEFAGDTVHYQWPSRFRTARMLESEPNEDWYDDIGTPARENLTLLVNRAFRDAKARLRNPAGGFTSWSAYRPVHIRHLAHIDAFSSLGLSAGGCTGCVNSLKGGHGPSWRMAVDLGPEPRALGIYPGGQSGNPGSPHYDDFVADWAAGKAYDLLFLSGVGSLPDSMAHRLHLRAP